MLSFSSPLGRSTVEIWQRHNGADLVTRVELVTGRKRTILHSVPQDGEVDFVQVYWTPGETKVGVFASGLAIFGIAFDVKTGKPIPFEEVRKGLSESIRKEYPVPKGEDPLDWALMADSHVEFGKRHPEFGEPSYFHW